MAHDEQPGLRHVCKRRQPCVTRRPPPASRRCGWGSIWAPATWCRWWLTVTASRLRYALTGPTWCATASSGISLAPSPSCADISTLEQQLGCRFTHAATSFPPGTDPRISINVLESAGLEISHVLDEPTAVADLLQLDNAGVVDIGGGTTGIAIVKQGRVTYSADEATGGHHISLTLAGNRGIGLEEAEQYKRSHAGRSGRWLSRCTRRWPKLSPDILPDKGIVDLWLAGGACMQPGVHELFRQRFPALPVHLPQHSLFMTPLAIANSGREKAEGMYAK